MKLPDFSENFHSEKEKKILDDLDEKMDGLRQLISNTLNRHMFFDEQAWTWTERLEKWAQQVQKNSRRGHDTACYTMRTMGFSCVRGILIESFAMNRKMPNR